MTIINAYGNYHKEIINNKIVAIISCTPKGRWYRLPVKSKTSGGHADYSWDETDRVYGSRGDLLG